MACLWNAPTTCGEVASNLGLFINRLFCDLAEDHGWEAAMAEDDFRRDAMWRMYNEHCTHMRHHEVQRSTVATSMIGIAGALLGIVTYDRAIMLSDVPLLLMVCALGGFGAMFALKQWERSTFHMERARAFRNAIDAEMEGAPIHALHRAADKVHKERFGVLHKIKLSRFWTSVYLFIVFTSVVLIMMAIFSPGK
jgi:hypothetical protein